VYLDGEITTGLPPYEIAKSGIGRTFQNLQIFGDMPVIDNVIVGLQCGSRYSVWENLLKIKSKIKTYEEHKDKAIEILKFFSLDEKYKEKAKNLPYGQQKLLEIARAMGTNPKVLLLDEPAAGMNPRETIIVTELIREIKNKLDITIIIIEHNIQMIMNLADTITVLDHGVKIAEGEPNAVKNDSKVIEAYLGVPAGIKL